MISANELNTLFQENDKATSITWYMHIQIQMQIRLFAWGQTILRTRQFILLAALHQSVKVLPGTARNVRSCAILHSPIHPFPTLWCCLDIVKVATKHVLLTHCKVVEGVPTWDSFGKEDGKGCIQSILANPSCSCEMLEVQKCTTQR